MTSRLRLFLLAAKPRARKGRADAFTLVELLIGASLSVIVVSSLAAVALIAELRMGRDAELNQSLRDHWGRTLAFINNEAQQAYWIRTTATDWPCGGEGMPEGPLLVLEGPPNPATNGSPSWTVAYGVRANGSSTQWRGFNRLVRCGPTFMADSRQGKTPEEQRAEALAGNLDYTALPTESVIADQLAQTDPFQTRLDDSSLARSRDAEVSLFMSRRTGLSYPPAQTLGTAFHSQLRANRNPGFDATGNPACDTTTVNGSEEPNLSGSCPLLQVKDSQSRVSYIKEYNLPPSGTLFVNRCSTVPDCQGPKNTTTIDVVFLKGNIADFTTKQFAAPGKPNATDNCSRTSCYVSNGNQNVQIYDGNVLVFYDGMMRL
jgi:hypothetical protein